MDQALQFIKPELMVLVPVLYFIGMTIKNSEPIKDKYIPVILGVVGIMFSVLWVIANTDFITYRDVLMAVFVAVTQGILVAGCSVYINQLYKQRLKDE